MINEDKELFDKILHSEYERNKLIELLNKIDPNNVPTELKFQIMILLSQLNEASIEVKKVHDEFISTVKKVSSLDEELQKIIRKVILIDAMKKEMKGDE